MESIVRRNNVRFLRELTDAVEAGKITLGVECIGGYGITLVLRNTMGWKREWEHLCDSYMLNNWDQ